MCLFPEGMSRYHPTIAPLKTGGTYAIFFNGTSLANSPTVARLVSDVLSQNRHNPDFEIDVLTCSITYMCVSCIARCNCLTFWQAPAALSLRRIGDLPPSHEVHSEGNDFPHNHADPDLQRSRTTLSSLPQSTTPRCAP